MGNKKLDAGSIAVAIDSEMIRSAVITIFYADNTKKKTKIALGDGVSLRALKDNHLIKVMGNITKIYESEDGSKAEQIKVDYSIKNQTQTVVIPITNIKDISNVSCPDYDVYYDKLGNIVIDDSDLEEDPKKDEKLTIKSVKDITLEQADELPDEVTCIMSDGTEVIIDVEEWGEDATTEFIGTSIVEVILEGGTYTVKLIVTEAEQPVVDPTAPTIVSIMPLTLNLGSELPSTITAVMSDDTQEEYTNFTWGTGASTTKLGTRTAKVLINGISYNVTLTIIEPTVVITIKSIKPVSVEQGSELPTKVTAIMSDNTEKEYDVTGKWGVGTNTSTVGTRNVSVTIENNIYTVSFTVTALPVATIVSVNTVTVEQGSVLPTKVTAVMSDDTSKEVTCSWTPSTNTLTPGSYMVYVVIDGENYAVNLVVTEKPAEDLVTIASIPDITIEKGTSLPSTITVVLSNNTQTTKPVTWSTFDSSIVKSENVTATIEGKPYTVKVNVVEPVVVEKTIVSIKPLTIEKGSTTPTQVTAIMSDDSEQVYTVDSWGVELDLANAGTNDVTVTVNGIQYNVSVTVTEPVVVAPTIVSIKPITVNRTTESLPTQVTAIMSDSDEETYPVQQWDEDFDLATATLGENVVSVIIAGESYDVTVTVTEDPTHTEPDEPTITSIKAVTVEKDSEAPTQVTAIMSNNSEKVYTVDSWGSELDLTRTGTNDVTVTVKGQQYTVSVTVTEPVVVEPTIVSIKAIEIEKDSEAPTEVTAIMSDNSEKAYTVDSWGSELDLANAGTNNVTVTVKGQQYTVSVTVTPR